MHPHSHVDLADTIDPEGKIVLEQQADLYAVTRIKMHFLKRGAPNSVLPRKRLTQFGKLCKEQTEQRPDKDFRYPSP